MEHVDDFAIGRHGATGGENDGQYGGGADQDQHQEARDDDGAGHCVQLLPPGGMGIKAGAIYGGEIALEAFNIGIGRVSQLDHDEARNFDGGQVEASAEPRLEQGLAFFDGESARRGNARSGLCKRDCSADI